MIRTEALEPCDRAGRAAPAPFACFGESGMHRRADAAAPPPAAGLFGVNTGWGAEPLLALRRASGCDRAYGAAA